ncbi:uncharacterized protein LOC126407421 [Scomber scombrus]|uniref:Uncharacterized protein LOC126407421 n=1 Tax=Scomber scombrus TaxID=13677 RepID=A0AAV1PGG4_SCOSC
MRGSIPGGDVEPLPGLGRLAANNSAREAVRVRETFTTFFSAEGTVACGVGWSHFGRWVRLEPQGLKRSALQPRSGVQQPAAVVSSTAHSASNDDTALTPNQYTN